jgi:hypothetical protein
MEVTQDARLQTVSNTEKALKLEQDRLNKLLIELNKKENDRVTYIKVTAAARGVLSSDGTIRAIADVRSEKFRRLVSGAIRLRRQLVEKFPELGAEASVDQLSAKVTNLIENIFSGVAAFMPLNPEAARAVESKYEHDSLVLQEEAKHQFNMFKQEIALTGPVFGGVHRTLKFMGQTGLGELAESLQQLASAISTASDLGDERGVYLEQLDFVARQAMEPQRSRQVSLVKGVVVGLRASLQDAGNIGQILSVAEPAIARHFGFNWRK